ncbi:MAG: hypothetical protein COC16_01870 [Lutibacter sp.]|nr:MAG: hypothetical protein COC16_01870 [Lutibacter sp.]
MNKTLHILNGDRSKIIFEKSGIMGDVVVWREMLCEGPLTKDVGSDEFWMRRYTYFENEIGINRLDYYDKSISEIVKLEDVSNYKDIVLWFEFDLFCQVNLLAVCAYLLNNYVKKSTYHLVCTGSINGKEELQSLSDFTPAEFNMLFEKKIVLSKSSLQFAKESWNLYVENSIDKLKCFDFNQNSKFPYLKLTIDQHLERFPSENGLNQIENKMLEIIDSGVSTKNNIVKELLVWQKKYTVYGFGDLQYFLKLKNLKAYYFVHKNSISLNSKGKELVK